MFLCTCNNCGGIFEDTNPQSSGPDKSLHYEFKDESNRNLYVEGLEDHNCPTCGNDDCLVDNINYPALNELTKEMAALFIIIN